MKAKSTTFECDNDLGQYTNSLLFDSNADIAYFEMTDENDNTVHLWLTVRGEKEVSLIDEDGNATETYRNASDYPEELINAIKNGENYEDYYCDTNNWFEMLYGYSKAGEKETGNYVDGEVWDDISSSPDQLKGEMRDFAESLFEKYYEKGTFEKSAKKPKDIERG